MVERKVYKRVDLLDMTSAEQKVDVRASLTVVLTAGVRGWG